MVARVITAIVTCRGRKPRKLKLVRPVRLTCKDYSENLSPPVEHRGVLLDCLKGGRFDLEKPPTRSPQEIVAFIRNSEKFSG